MLICLYIIYGCFCSTKAELSVCNRDYKTSEAENIYYLTLYIESLLTPALGKYNHIGTYKVFLPPPFFCLSPHSASSQLFLS